MRSRPRFAVDKSFAANDERDLVELCRLGDRDAWRALHARYLPSVERYVRVLRVPEPERDDATQEIFVSIYLSLPGFRQEAKLSTWIYRIAARHASKIRRRWKRVECLDGQPRWAAREPVTLEAQERVARALFLRRLLDRLSPKKRTVFVLFELGGLQPSEIARIADCPENTVWSRLHHARREMSQMADREPA